MLVYETKPDPPPWDRWCAQTCVHARCQTRKGYSEGRAPIRRPPERRCGRASEGQLIRGRDLWKTVLNGAQSHHYLNGLAPERGLVSVEPLERATVEMGEPQKTVGQHAGRVCGILG